MGLFSFLTPSIKRKRQYYGTVGGLVIVIGVTVFLSIPTGEEFLSKGPMNTGHDDLECIDCHVKAPGGEFQQIVANFKHATGMRKDEVDFGYIAVDSKKCESCHDRPNDRHPIQRFNEPRFSEARKNIGPTKCESCHLEHNDVRLTIANTGFCLNCHQELELKNDPLDIPHADLVKNEAWETCLQCHDFHGNHKYHVAETMKDTIEIEKIRAYFEGGESPYGDVKKYLPKNKPSDELKKGY